MFFKFLSLNIDIIYVYYKSPGNELISTYFVARTVCAYPTDSHVTLYKDSSVWKEQLLYWLGSSG